MLSEKQMSCQPVQAFMDGQLNDELSTYILTVLDN